MIRSYIKHELEWVEYPYKGGSMAQESTLFARYLFDFVNYVTCGNYTIDEKTRYLLNGDDMISKTYYDVGVVDYLNGTDYSVTDRLLVAEALKNTTCMPLEHLTPFYLENPVFNLALRQEMAEAVEGSHHGALVLTASILGGIILAYALMHLY